MKSGKTVSGEVMAVTDSSVTLGRVGNYGFEERTVLSREIAELKAEDPASLASTAAGASAVLIVMGAVGIVVLAALIGHVPSN